MPRLETFAYNIVNIVQIEGFTSDRIENIAGNRENAGYQHFLLSQKVFKNFLPEIR